MARNGICDPECIICYGDSNTYGYDPCSLLGDRYPKGQCWTEIAEKKTGIWMKNYGLCGRKIPHLESQLQYGADQFKMWSSSQEETWLWIMLGTNDLLEGKGITAEETASRMEIFLQYLREAVPEEKGRLRLIAPVPLKRGAWVESEQICEESERLSGFYRALSEKYHTDFTDAGEWEIPLAYDGVHFTEMGHTIFGEKITDTL